MSEASATTITVLTPTGRGAVASVSVKGRDAVTVVERCFSAASSKRISELPLRRIVFGCWTTSGAGPGEDLVVCRMAIDHVEIHCHGGTAAVEAIAASLTDGGAVRRESDGWSLAHSSEFIQAEARLALADAKTERTALILLDQFHDALRREVKAILARLAIGDVSIGRAKLAKLSQRVPAGQHLTTPWRIAISGPPNVGKSSLMNALVGYSRSIVFDQPGTTHDLVTAETAFDGWPMQLIDTAGLRQTDDCLEAAGIDRATQAIRTADLELFVADATEPTMNAAERYAATAPRIVVLNKLDLCPRLDFAWPGVKVSAKTGEGVPDLMRAAVAALLGVPPSPGEPVPFTPRQAALLAAAKRLVEGNDLPGAADSLKLLIR